MTELITADGVVTRDIAFARERSASTSEVTDAVLRRLHRADW